MFSYGRLKESSTVSAVTSASWSPATHLFSLSNRDHITLGTAIEGILITGRTGSGKSTSSGRTIAHSFLRAGFGGLVLCAKLDERALWEQYARETNRLADLIVFSPSNPWRFNFIDHEQTRPGGGAGHTENILNLLSTVMEMIERSSGQGSGRGDEAYWRRAQRQLIRNLTDLLTLATGHVSVPDLYRLAVSAPISAEAIRSDAWMKQSFCFHCLTEADKRLTTPRQRSDFALVADYFLQEFPNLSEKTRSVVLSTFTSMIDVLNRGVLRELFCESTNISPEAIPEGKIVIVDLSVKEYGEIGLIANTIWKYAFMRSIERRNVEQNPRPVFLWQDEGQLFTTSHDMAFQTTARSSRVATVILTQSVNNFYAVLGEGQQGKAQADSIFGNLNLKIFHANGDPVTNEWASSLVGKRKQFMLSVSGGQQPTDWASISAGLAPSQANASMSEHYEFEVQPSAFTKLRTGGPANGWVADAIVISSGMWFQATGRSWLRVTFRQR